MFRAQKKIRPRLETPSVEVDLQTRVGEEEKGGDKATEAASTPGEEESQGEEGPEESHGGMLPQEDSYLLARRVRLQVQGFQETRVQ